MRNIEVLLHNIRSVYNVASMFRTADGAGISKIYLSGYSPDPIGKYGEIRKDFHKVALGAENSVDWERCDAEEIVKEAKAEGVATIAVEQTDKSADYRNIKIPDNILLVFGNEVEGVDEKILELCDMHVEIPMRGIKKSLNVSVCFGIVVYEYAK